MISPQISIGPLTFHLYGAIIAVSIYLGWHLAKKRASANPKLRKLFDDPILITPLILAIVGARLYHVLDLWDYYSQYPNQAIAVWNGGLGIWGALGGMFLGFWFIAKVKKIDVLSFLDLVSPSILLGQALGRIGNFVNQEAFGPPTNLPWGIYIDPANRPSQYLTSDYFHPTFFYEAILDLIFFSVLLFLSKPSTISYQLSTIRRGQTFALYLILYSAGRAVAEFWRLDTATFGAVRVAHLLSIATFALGLWLFVKFKKNHRTP